MIFFRKFYGSTVREILQGPGETLYIPGNFAHSVMNMDETVSVTENYNQLDNIEDFVHGYVPSFPILY